MNKNLQLYAERDKCIECGGCLSVCESSVLRLTSASIKIINPSECTGCRRCIYVCPTNVLSFKVIG